MNSTKTSLQNDIQSLICKLPDIINCSVVYDEDSNIEEIHILAAVGRNIKQLVRDIQSAINAKFNIAVDYKKISIAQINEAEFKEARVRIESIAVKNIDNMIEATVVLSYDGKIYEGKSSKVKSKSNRVKAVAEATLAALESYMCISGALYLEGLESLKISGKEVYVSLIGFSQDNIEEYFS
ncbi:MAG: hypothetical protein PHS15_07755, partial [Clostridiaceae bacterium]|nr:hypothetical protein [Clostridiaceae bacterium]